MMTANLSRFAIFVFLGAVGVLICGSFFAAPWAPVSLKVAVAAFGVCAMLRPDAAASILAGLLPLTTMVAVLWVGNVPGSAIAEVMVVVFLSGVALHLARAPRAPDRPHALWGAAFLFAVAVAASCIVVLAAEHAGEPRSTTDAIRNAVFGHFRTGTSSRVVLDAALLIEGMGLLLAVGTICRTAPLAAAALPRMIVAGAAGAATLNINRLLVAALQREFPLASFLHSLVNVRTDIHYGDVNAAGAYFLMTFVVAGGLVVSSKRRAETAVWSFMALIIGLGLWLTGSRSAMIVGVSILFISALRAVTRRRSVAAIPRRTAALMGAAAVIAILALMLQPRMGLTGASSYAIAVQSRFVLVRSGFQMLATNPLFGIGIAQFYPESARYTGPERPGGTEHAHAHNNFLQILSELGLLGFGLFLMVIGVSLRLAWRATWRGGRDPTCAAILIGVAAFLFVSLGMHPLLTPQVSYQFWILLGTMTGLAERRLAVSRSSPSAAEPSRTSSYWRAACAIAASAIAVTIPFRAAASVRTADLGGYSVGLSKWQTASDGSRFRWAAAASTFFVPGDVGSVVVPLRARPASVSIAVEISLDGQPVNRVIVMDDQWLNYRLLLPPGRSAARFRRVDLRVVQTATITIDTTRADADATTSFLMVGKTTFPPVESSGPPQSPEGPRSAP